MDEARTCLTCGEPRVNGSRLCRDCLNRQRRERYQLDPQYRVDEKARNRVWKDANKERVAEKQRQRRAAKRRTIDQGDHRA